MAPGDVAIEYLELGEEIGALRRKIARAFSRWLLGVSEHGDIRRVQGAEQKVHPTLDHGALGRARSDQRRPMHGGEIAKDGMGFPDHEIAVDQGRDLRSGIELAVCLGQRVAELATARIKRSVCRAAHQFTRRAACTQWRPFRSWY